jgi:hypothetical protein
MRQQDIDDMKAREQAGAWNNLKVDDPNEVGVGDVVFVLTLDRNGVVAAKLKCNRYKVEVGKLIGGHHVRRATGGDESR